MWPFTSNAWKTIGQAKRDERTKALQSAQEHQESFVTYTKASGKARSRLPHGCMLRVTYAASEIVAHIEQGEWTASDVLEAYISRPIFSHERTNCITEGQQLRACYASHPLHLA